MKTKTISRKMVLSLFTAPNKETIYEYEPTLDRVDFLYKDGYDYAGERLCSVSISVDEFLGIALQTGEIKED